MILYNTDKQPLYKDESKTIGETFVNAMSKGIKLPNLRLDNVKLRGDPNNKMVFELNMPKAKLTNCIFENIIIKGDLRDNEISDCSFNECIFQKTNLDDSFFNRCQIKQSKVLDCSLEYCEFNFSDIDKVEFNSKLYFTMFKNGVISSSNIQDLFDGLLMNNKISNSRLNGNLYETNITNNDISKLTIANSSMKKGVFNSNKIAKLKFLSCDLEEVKFDSCDTEELTFINSDLSKTAFATCTISKAKFEANKLNTTTFQNCRFNNSKWQENFFNAYFLKCQLNNNLFKDNMHPKIQGHPTTIYLAACNADGNSFIGHDTLQLLVGDSNATSINFIDNKTMNFNWLDNKLNDITFSDSPINKSTFKDNQFNNLDIIKFVNLVDDNDNKLERNTLFIKNYEEYNACKNYAINHPNTYTNYLYSQNEPFLDLNKHQTPVSSEESELSM